MHISELQKKPVRRTGPDSTESIEPDQSIPPFTFYGATNLDAYKTGWRNVNNVFVVVSHARHLRASHPTSGKSTTSGVTEGQVGRNSGAEYAPCSIGLSAIGS